MKKFLNIILTIILLIFSFYYTKTVAEFIKNKDLIMIKIKENSYKFETNSIDAIIKNDTIIPGKSSKKVNINASYKKMKRIKKYTESLYVFEYKKPKISLKDHYDKIIINGNTKNKNISILIKVQSLELLKKINTDPFLNFILDNDFINTNLDYIIKLDNNIVVLEQNNLNNLEIIDYCYSENIFNKYCINYKIYTIKPTFITNNYYYNTFKLINNGSILAYNILNENDIKDINLVISYIKTLNYNIVSIDNLINE